LLKKEFDQCRYSKKSHRKLVDEGLSHIIPYDPGEEIIVNSKKQNENWKTIDVWRDAMHKGLKRRFKDTNIILQGGVDEVRSLSATSFYNLVQGGQDETRDIGATSFINLFQGGQNTV
jgi:hypothetical protein